MQLKNNFHEGAKLMFFKYCKLHELGGGGQLRNGGPLILRKNVMKIELASPRNGNF